MEFSELFSSYLLPVFLVIWGILSLSKKDARDAVLQNVAQAIKNDKLHVDFKIEASPVIYSRDDLQKNSEVFERKFVEPIATPIKDVNSWVNTIWGKLNDANKPFAIFGYLFQFVLAILFLWAEMISVYNSLEARSPEIVVMPIFARLEIAITLSSIASIFVAVLVFFDVVSNKALTDWGSNDSKLMRISIQIISVILILSGIFVITAIGAFRFEAAGHFTTENAKLIRKITDGVLFFLVPVNSAIALGLIHRGTLYGFYAVLLGIIKLFIVVIFGILHLIYSILAYLLFMIMDLIARLTYISLHLGKFYLLTPIDKFSEIIESRK